MCIISYSLKGMYKLLFFIAYFTLISFPSSGEITQKIKDLNSAAPFTDVKNLTSDLKLINNAMNSTIHIEGRLFYFPLKHASWMVMGILVVATEELWVKHVEDSLGYKYCE